MTPEELAAQAAKEAAELAAADKKTADDEAAKEAAELAAADKKTADDEAASKAAAELAQRRHATERATESRGDSPARMVDLHDLRADILDEVAKMPSRAEPAGHAVPAADDTRAQTRRPGRLAVLGGILVIVVVLVALVALSRSKGTPAP